MSKRWGGLFGDQDLFFANKLKPLLDSTKMRKFHGSRIIAGILLGASLYIPYWWESSNTGYTPDTITTPWPSNTTSRGQFLSQNQPRPNKITKSDEHPNIHTAITHLLCRQNYRQFRSANTTCYTANPQALAVPGIWRNPRHSSFWRENCFAVFQSCYWLSCQLKSPYRCAPRPWPGW